MKKVSIALVSIVAIVLCVGQFSSSEKKAVVGIGKNQPTIVEEIKGEVINIGVFQPLTGTNKEGGISELEGILLANELYPMINGNKIIIHVADHESDRDNTVNVVMNLIEKNKVKALIGSWGSAYALSAGPVINEEKIPTVGASCTNPRITIGNRYYSRVSYIDSFQGTALANFAYNKLNAKTAAILMEDRNEYSMDLGEYFINAFAELNNYRQSILVEEFYQTGQMDFSSIVAKIKSLNPEIVFIPGNYEEVAEITKQLRDAKIDSKIIGTDTLDTIDFNNISGQYSEGIYFSTFYSHEISKTEESKKFLLAYQEKYNKTPNSFSALGYDAYLLIYDALKRVKNIEPEEINDAIHLAKNVEGAAGVITMDQNGDTVRDVVIKQIIDGKSRFITFAKPNN